MMPRNIAGLTDGEPWQARLIQSAGDNSLVTIASQGRLAREGPLGTVRVQLTPVDECVLALVDLALRKRKDITFVYPAPAGQVAVFLAAEILLHQFVRGIKMASVGLLSADTTGASRAWEELRITAPASRTPISEVFPCFRCGPDGESPFRKRRFQGLLVGQHHAGWPVDTVIVDHLAGPVFGEPSVPTVRIFADPLDGSIELLANAGHLIWGWSREQLAACYHDEKKGRGRQDSSFSVDRERLVAVASGVRTAIHVVCDSEAEKCVARIRDDLWTLAELADSSLDRAIVSGLRVAWHHLSTLTSLPCRPSEFDQFAGIPPIAARPTMSFAQEIGAWSRTLPGEAGEIASVLASDLADLRAVLEDENPFSSELLKAMSEEIDTLVVLRTQTARRALLKAMGEDPYSSDSGRIHVRSLGQLHREGTFPRAIVVGVPPRWDWHRLDSGLSRDLNVLALGWGDARRSQSILSELQRSRQRWGSAEMRNRVWQELVDGPPPTTPLPKEETMPAISIVATVEMPSQADPFEALEPLLVSSRLMIGDEGLQESIAEEGEDGTWSATIDAVEVETDVGRLLLPRHRLVEVRKGDRITDCVAEKLDSGMYLLIGRQAGRIGLLDAVAERLVRNRPDLLAANLLVGELRVRVLRAFEASGLTKTELYEKMAALGFAKTYQAASGYVEHDGPMAPRDLMDLKRLNSSLELGLGEQRIRETFAGVRRIRAFRRAAGRALAAAARGSTVATEMARVDPETGLSLADLRDVVLEARVLKVTRCAGPVLLADVGRLEATL